MFFTTLSSLKQKVLNLETNLAHFHKLWKRINFHEALSNLNRSVIVTSCQSGFPTLVLKVQSC